MNKLYALKFFSRGFISILTLVFYLSLSSDSVSADEDSEVKYRDERLRRESTTRETDLIPSGNATSDSALESENSNGLGSDRVGDVQSNLPSSKEEDQLQPPVGHETSNGWEQSALSRSELNDHLEYSVDGDDKREIVFKIGRLNGLPISRGSDLVKGEFGILTVESKVTHISIEDATDSFPQRLSSGQSLVLHFPEVPAEHYILNIQLAATGTIYDGFGGALEFPFLNVKVNDRLVWRRSLPRHDFLLQSILLGDAFEAHENVLLIENIGRETIAFDCIWVEKARSFPKKRVGFGVLGYEEIPDALRSRFNALPITRVEQEISSQFPVYFPIETRARELRDSNPMTSHFSASLSVRTPRSSFEWQEANAEEFIHSISSFYCNGGRFLALNDLLRYNGVIDPLTLRVLPKAYSVDLFSRAFDGRPVMMPLNILSSTGSPLFDVYGFCLWNSPDQATIVLSGGRGSAYPLKVRVEALVPWKGDSSGVVQSGIFRESARVISPPSRATIDGPYDRYLKKENFFVSIPGTKSFEMELDVKRPTVVLLSKKGASIATSRLADVGEFKSPRFMHFPRKGVLVRDDRKGLSSFSVIPISPALSIATRSARFRISAPHLATRGLVGNIDYISPINAKSVSVNIGSQRTVLGDGFCINGSLASKVDGLLSFWVLPHVSSDCNGVSLKFYIGHYAGDLKLQPNRWQNVTLAVPSGEATDGNFVVWDVRDSETNSSLKDINLEFNSFEVLRNKDALNVSVKAEKDRVFLRLKGAPESIHNVRLFFDKPRVIRSVSAGNSSEFTWEYTKESQMLELCGLRMPGLSSKERSGDSTGWADGGIDVRDIGSLAIDISLDE